ncbi:MAG TPA: nuclear transport factor 2 family protein, partial [Polyangiales bacterium]|nr:nuclear transport factor 2 family protein [Polyangiales bacterium]
MSEPQTEQPGSTLEHVLALVRRSPEFVREHDRAGWLGLFGTDGVIEDPVGSPPARVADGTLARFWDTFIGPNEVEFEVHRDCQVGHAVFRDAIVHTRIAGTVTLDVPAYLLYEVAEDGRSVARMSAHWPLSSLSLSALKLGPAAWIQMIRLFVRMLRNMGPRWVGGYLAALWDGVGARGPRTLAQLCAAVEARDPRAIASLFTDEHARVALGAQARSVAELLELLPAGS